MHCASAIRAACVANKQTPTIANQCRFLEAGGKGQQSRSTAYLGKRVGQNVISASSICACSAHFLEEALENFIDVLRVHALHSAQAVVQKQGRESTG